MPELPEVEVISNFLLDKIKNKQISNVTVNNWNLRVPITKNIDDLLKGKVINDIKRREPLTDEFSGGYLQELLKNKKVNIKSALMDNKLIVGVGNIYASESLFRARISPLRSAKDLTYRECEKLAAEIKNTLSDAIAAGGSTLKDYAQPSGSAGYFQNNFYVYGKVQKPCKICNNIITLIRQNGRSTYFCNACQN
ncbi:formamidopyrimidine-DNA glycosylase [Trichonephila clavata]|uniref:Formamidopyrimidine-DNA glycosylase n=1 Tax=Trichonephila clavata TaxID=2740835 RepID=A0A8X6G3J8_TRICU|nr:formamidopyrimidine-DNA glycosylase [Trichonephila clavata]